MKFNNSKPVMVFNLRVAQELILQGHIVVNVEVNHKNRSKVVFFFKPTDEFLSSFEEITK